MATVEREVMQALMEGGEAEPFDPASVAPSSELAGATRTRFRAALHLLLDQQTDDGRWSGNLATPATLITRTAEDDFAEGCARVQHRRRR